MKYPTRHVIRDYGITVVLAVSVALLIRTYIIEAYQIPSFSMKPTLLSGDTIFVAKWPVWLDKVHFPDRGDVVVFSGLENGGRVRLDYVKRVIGLPGDELRLQKGVLYRNHQKLDLNQSSELCSKEQLPSKKEYTVCRDSTLNEDFGPEKVPTGSVFVIGDFRSQGSEVKNRKPWSIVSLSSLKGKALWIWLSIDPNQNQKGSRFRVPSLRLERMFRRIQ